MAVGRAPSPKHGRSAIDEELEQISGAFGTQVAISFRKKIAPPPKILASENLGVEEY